MDRCQTNKLFYEQNEAAINGFPSILVNFYYSETVNPHSWTLCCEIYIVREYVVPETNHEICPEQVPPRHLQLKRGVSIWLSQISLPSSLVNGKVSIVKANSRKIIEVAAVNNNGDEFDIFSSHQIWFHIFPSRYGNQYGVSTLVNSCWNRSQLTSTDIEQEIQSSIRSLPCLFIWRNDLLIVSFRKTKWKSTRHCSQHACQGRQSYFANSLWVCCIQLVILHYVINWKVRLEF